MILYNNITTCNIDQMTICITEVNICSINHMTMYIYNTNNTFSIYSTIYTIDHTKYLQTTM